MTHSNDISTSIQVIPASFNLSHFGSLAISGKDAKSFLQGQLTCDMNTLQELTAQPTACCNIQGRIIALCFVLIWQDGYLLIMPQNILNATLKHFKKYALFSKVTFEQNILESITGFSGAAPEKSYQCLKRLYIKPNMQPPVGSLDYDAWHYQQIIQGFPDLYPDTQEVFLPHRLELEKIDAAISFQKGCYLGQEIIARTHFKAVKKHAVYLCEIKDQRKPGENILSDSGESIGEFIDIAISPDGIQHSLIALKIDSLEKLPSMFQVIYTLR